MNVQLTVNTACGVGLCVSVHANVYRPAFAAVSHWSQKLSPFLSQSPASSLSNKEACLKMPGITIKCASPWLHVFVHTINVFVFLWSCLVRSILPHLLYKSFASMRKMKQRGYVSLDHAPLGRILHTSFVAAHADIIRQLRLGRSWFPPLWCIFMFYFHIFFASFCLNMIT